MDTTITQRTLTLVAAAIIGTTAAWAEKSDAAVFPLTEAGKKLEVRYAAEMKSLSEEIERALPLIDDAARKSLVEAKDAEARVAALRKTPELEKFLAIDSLDGKLAKFFVLKDGTPSGLAAFAQQGEAPRKALDALLADDSLMIRIAVADGARPLLVNRSKSPVGRYDTVMETLSAIHNASPKSKEGILGRLALAVSLELSEPIHQSKGETPADAPRAIDPLKRYLHYEKAYEAGELDLNFDQLSVWELRFVVCAPEPDEALAWGREMLRNYRPDHIYTENEGWRYANVVNTDVRYGSLHVGNDKPELFGVQNILMNGGICGRRSFFARYICRAFGIPATARPSSGHGASARWSPQGWVVVLGPPWRHGWTLTRYRNGLDFVAHTQARARGEEFLKVKRAFWIGDVMGESRFYGEHNQRDKLAFWNAVALATQGRLIEDANAEPLDALGAELGEANGPTVAEQVMATDITPEDRKISHADDGNITIPAAACSKTSGDTNDVIVMKSFAGGLQVFLPYFNRQQPILVRGGSWCHEASLCESATRHWRGRRPKKSYFMRGLRLAVTPDGNQPQKELELELAEGVTMEFVYIPPGKFIMGGDRKEKEGDYLANTPKHEVTLTQGFYLGKYEVTQAQYAAVMDKDQGKSATGADHPVDGVKPSRALLMCDELSASTGMEVRLATEAEWEYAARAGSDTRWHFGDDPAKLVEYAWFKDNAEGKSHPVGQKKPNPWGLYDMYGNIAEFVRDEHQEDYYAQGPKVDPVGPLMGIYSSMECAFDVPKAGAYTIRANVVTAHEDQSLQLAVNGAESPVTIKLPFTLGKWGESATVTVTLKEGKNTLHFWRSQAPQYGVAVKSFTLQPR